MPFVLLENDGYCVERHEAPRYLRVQRKAFPFESRRHCDQICAPVQQALDAETRQRWPLLIDSRLAVRRNDPEYEDWFAYHREAMLIGFPRVCILLLSAVGKMHAERMLRAVSTMPSHVRISTDEVFALHWLTGLDAPSPEPTRGRAPEGRSSRKMA